MGQEVPGKGWGEVLRWANGGCRGSGTTAKQQVRERGHGTTVEKEQLLSGVFPKHILLARNKN